MSRSLQAIIGVLFFAVVAIGVWFGVSLWWSRYQQSHLIESLTSSSYRENFTQVQPSKPYEVMGFLPYWTVSKAQFPKALTDVAYFSVSFNGYGQLAQQENGAEEPGYSRLHSESFTDWIATQPKDRKLSVTLFGEDDDAIRQLLSSPVSHQEFRDNVSQLVASYPFTGVVFDFEYVSDADPTIRAQYVELIRQVASDLHKMNPDLKVSVAVYATAATNPDGFFDIPALNNVVDNMVIMTYDYHSRNSPSAGPNAPLFGKDAGRWQNDITSNLHDYLKIVPPEKIILGIPFYGYEWQITTGSNGPSANTYPSSGSTPTYEAIQELLQEKANVQNGWDADALSPYVTFTEGSKKMIIYYDDPRSLSYKLDLVKQLNLGGIAIWALGYEGDHQELWQVIQQKLQP